MGTFCLGQKQSDVRESCCVAVGIGDSARGWAIITAVAVHHRLGRRHAASQLPQDPAAMLSRMSR